MSLFLIKSELRRQLFHEGVHSFYFFSIIFWPMLSFLQLVFNFQIFPLKLLRKIGVHTNQQLFHYIFIGYCALTIFQTTVQSAWSFSFEKRQGTISQIFMTPVNKMSWLYSRTLAIVLTNGWLYLSLFLVVNYWYLGLSAINFSKMLISFFLLLIAAMIWGAFIMVFFIVLRDGSILFVFLEGPQETFCGVKAPVQVMPMTIKAVAGLFPLTYTILILRELLISGDNLWFLGCLYIGINLILLISTRIVFTLGEKHMRKVGSFDLY